MPPTVRQFIESEFKSEQIVAFFSDISFNQMRFPDWIWLNFDRVLLIVKLK